MKKNLRLFALIFVLAIAMVSCGQKPQASSDDPFAEVKERGKLILATSADYPPYEFKSLKDGKETYAGFDIAMAQYMADKIGVELEIRDMEFKNVIGAVTSGMADIGIAGISPKADRTEVLFSDIYYQATHGALVRKADLDKYKSEDDLKSKKIGVQIGSIQEDMAKKIEGADVVSLPLVTTLIQELKTKKVDAIIVEKPVGEAFAKVHDDLAMAEGIELIDPDGGSAIAINKEKPAFRDAINELIKEIKEKNLFENWVVEAHKAADEAQ